MTEDKIMQAMAGLDEKLRAWINTKPDDPLRKMQRAILLDEAFALVALLIAFTSEDS